MRSFLFCVLLALSSAAYGQTAPRAGEIRLEGAIASVAPDGKSFGLEVDTFTLPSGKSSHLATPKVRKILLTAESSISPRGDTNWLLKPASLRMGYTTMVVGKDGANKEFAARGVEIEREIEGRKLDYFVTQNGSDAAAGTANAPWRTIQTAVNRAPSGFSDEPVVVHIGAGDFGESSDGKNGQLLVSQKNNLILTGAGARIEGGTQISTGEYAKIQNLDVLRIENSQNIELCNLVIGDDKSWEEDRSTEGTIRLSGPSTVKLRALRIVGPSRETQLDAERKTAPVALRLNNLASVAELDNVLVTGHGSFLGNPEGKVFCRNVTFARMFGNGLDDHFLFLQTPHNAPRDDRRFTFENCLFYEMEGARGGGRFYLIAGDDGTDKAYFDAPKNGSGGNIMIRCRYEKPDTVYQTKNLGAAFLDTRGSAPRINSIWVDNDPQKELTGGVKVDNDVELTKRDGFLLCAPKALKSGWTGGFSAPASN